MRVKKIAKHILPNDKVILYEVMPRNRRDETWRGTRTEMPLRYADWHVMHIRSEDENLVIYATPKDMTHMKEE